MRTEGIASSMAYSTVEASASDAVENAARDEERERTQAAVAAALSGSPQLLIGMLMSRQRSNQSSMHASEVRSESLLSDNAQQAREEAMHAAEEAAKKAASFLGLSGVLGKIASIAALVASVSATVLTAGAGAAAIALAGSLLVACAEPLSSALVDAGIVPKKIAAEFCLALQITGALMTGLAGGGSAAVGEGSKGALAAARLLDTAANAVSGAATVGRAGATVGGAVHTRKSDHARAAAEMQKGRAEIAQAHVADAVGDVRSSEQSFARAMAAMKAMQDANGEALRSSVRMRG